MRIARVLGWIGINLACWLAATVAFGWCVARVVDEEYRTGVRTAEDGDAIMIPIAGFAAVLALLLLVGNLAWLAASAVRRRRSRSVT